MTTNLKYLGVSKQIPDEIKQAIELHKENKYLTKKEISKEMDISESTYYSAILCNNGVRPLQYDKIMNYYNNVVLNKKENIKAQVKTEEINQIVIEEGIKITKTKDKIVIEIM